MGREISLFSDYRQKENSLTNYCGLILKILYLESPRSFEEAIASMVPSDINLTVGPIFTQQQKQTSSIPDLSIVQQPFSIFFETKITDWFYSSQIKKHIGGFGNEHGTKILFLLSNFETDKHEERFANDLKVAKENNIILQPISFEEFIGTLEGIRSSDNFKNYLDEFKTYLDRSGHLPKWRFLLDVVNCSGTMNEIQGGAYMCPDKGGAYSHRRAKYFGPYCNKKVSKIYEIDAVVSVDIEQSNPSVKWKNKDIPNGMLAEIAISHLKKWPSRIKENKSTPLQVFILSNGTDTNFKKVSSGGMLQSKKYFWNIAVDCKNSIQLAEKLKTKTWE